MKDQVKSYMTGVAIVGASVIAVAPIAPPPLESVRSADIRTLNLLAATAPNELLAALIDATDDFLPGGSQVTAAQEEDPIGDLIQDFATAFAGISLGLGASGAALASSLGAAPTVVLALAGAVQAGALTPVEAIRTLAALAAGLPLGVANPTLVALINNLPEPIGGEDGLVAGFQEGFTDLTRAIQGILVPPNPVASVSQVTAAQEEDPIGDAFEAIARISSGFGQSGAIASTRLGLAPTFVAVLAQRVVAGQMDPVVALRQLAGGAIDSAYLGDILGPGALRPAINALRANLPGPIGGEDGVIDTVDEGATDVATDIRDTIRGNQVNQLPAGGPSTVVKVEQPGPQTQLAGSGQEELAGSGQEELAGSGQEELGGAGEEDAKNVGSNGVRKAPLFDMTHGGKVTPGANGPKAANPGRTTLKAVGDQVTTSLKKLGETVKKLTGGADDDDNGGAGATGGTGGEGASTG